VIKKDLKLYANPAAVITQFLYLPGENRISNIIERVQALREDEVTSLLQKLTTQFGWRHRNIEHIFADHFERINKKFKKRLRHFSTNRKLLLGAYFTKEYSLQAAALFNPSIVAHPHQENVPEGQQKFVMSLRATGEGHISSIIFHTGIVDASGDIFLESPAQFFTPLKKNETALFTRAFLRKRTAFIPGFNPEIIDLLPEEFTADDAIKILSTLCGKKILTLLQEIFDTNYEVAPTVDLPLNEKVIFPSSKAEGMGMEDVRFVQFKDGKNSCYYGTYTAYDGVQIKTQLIETKDFDQFTVRTLYGNAISDKGMALFPQKVNGKYVMISRQGGEKINIMYSDDLYVWDDFKTLMEPLYDWELVQLGNCGSPIRTQMGWLLLTHGVGVMRTYAISAVLLDLNDPSTIVGRLTKPLLEAEGEEREGYVPNVVYTCGAFLHNNILIIPYAMSDSSTGFVTIGLEELLDEFVSK